MTNAERLLSILQEINRAGWLLCADPEDPNLKNLVPGTRCCLERIVEMLEEWEKEL